MEENKTPTETISADYAIRDERNRAVGGRAYIVFGHWDDKTIRVYIQATRDGKNYGPSGRRSAPMATREVALAHAEAGLKAQAKRYAKKYGGK